MAILPASIDPPLAAGLLADWGFLVDPDLPHEQGVAHLLVAIRPTPTLRHYDPESVEYWITDASEHGARTTLTVRSRMPLEQEFGWGLITIVDRLRVSNEYLTFGGHLSADRIEGTVVCVFRSPAPLLRRGGHSQGWDRASQNVGAFFGRVRAAAGYAHDFEVYAASLDPLSRYAAFVRQLMARYRGSEYLRDRYPALWTTMVNEEHRLRREHPAEWARGEELLRAAAAATGSATGFRP
jgi:hypothetical protein